MTAEVAAVFPLDLELIAEGRFARAPFLAPVLAQAVHLQLGNHAVGDARGAAGLTAKQRVLEDIGAEPWCRGVGIGLVGPDRERGLVISVAPGSPPSLVRRLRSLAGTVPVELRVLGEVRKREPERTG